MRATRCAFRCVCRNQPTRLEGKFRAQNAMSPLAIAATPILPPTDYRPEIGEQRLQTGDGQVRDMELAEIAAADDL